jgi:Big-like domain-containing protein/concanavalin A-like lectin/glucanase superfamily protein/IPT/TIG domain-containing protein
MREARRADVMACRLVGAGRRDARRWAFVCLVFVLLAGLAALAARAPTATAASRMSHGALATDPFADSITPAVLGDASAPYPQAVLADHPIAYYRLDETEFTTAEDSSGNGLNATYVDSGAGPYESRSGAPVNDSDTAVQRYQNSGFCGPCTGMLAQSGSMLPAGNSPRTLEAWINEEGQPRYWSYNLFEYGDVAGGHGFTVNVGGEPRSTITVSGATQSVHLVVPGGLEGAGWELIDVTYQGGAVGIYVDGALIGGGSIGDAETVTPGQGLKVNGGSGTFGLDEVAIYPSALSPERIDDHWTVGQSYSGQPVCAATPTSPYASAVLADAPSAYYRLDEVAAHPTERVAFDSSGHCANATYADAGANQARTGPVLGDSSTALSRYLNSLFGSVSSGEMLEQSGNALPAGNSPRTLEAWVNEEGLPRYGSYNLFEYGEVAGGHGFTVNIGGEPRSTITVSGATQSVHAVVPGGLEDRTWHLVDVTYDGNLVEIYIDGQLIGGGEIGKAETAVPGEGLKIDGASGTFGLDEIAIYPTALSSAAIVAHWKAASEAPAGSSIIAGEAAIGGVGAAEGARIQACPTTGGGCQVDPWAVGSSGLFHMLVPDGTYTVTISPPAGLKDAPRVFGPMGLPPSVLNLSATFSPPDGLPEGVSFNGQENVLPRVNWGSPSTLTVKACKNGFGTADVEGTNTSTGARETVPAEFEEQPAESGEYEAQIRPLAPIHGSTEVSAFTSCPGQSAIIPDGGGEAGGSEVLIAGKELAGATAVLFGSTPATAFKVLANEAIEATVPAGSGEVAVSVITPGGASEVGSYSYIGVSSLATTSGPSTGGTAVTIHGTGFTDVKGVEFGLLPAASYTVVSPTEINAVAPQGLGAVDVQVINSLATTPLHGGDTFTYTGGPSGAGRIQEGSDPQAQEQLASAYLAQVPCSQEYQVLCKASSWVVEHIVAPVAKHLLPDPATGGVALGIGAVVWNAVRAVWAGCVPQICTQIVTAANIALDAAVDAALFVAPYLGPAIVGVVVGFAIAELILRFHPFGLFVDPSGTIVDTNGNPLSGATATLLEQPLADGPFIEVEPASGAIEPAENPETTGASGQFDWDALAGAYQVQASAPGCHAPGESQPDVFTSPFVLPPPAVGLMLTLECAGGGTAPTPKVTGLSISDGASAGGDVVDILGEGLADVTSVHFGAHASVHVQPLSPDAVAAVAPAGSGTVDVTVAGPGGTSAADEGDRYTYSTPLVSESSPVVESVTPSSGPLSGGTVVTIRGSHLAGALSVTFGGTLATQITPISDSEVQAAAPAAAFSARVDVAVATSSGGSAPTLADGFDYGLPPPPVATSVTLTPSPNPATAGQAVGLTAAVTPTDGGGTVAFYVDGSSTPISGCGAQSLSQKGTSYEAACSTTALAVGSQTLNAVYSGDASYAPSSGSASVSIVESAPPNNPSPGGGVGGTNGGGSGGGSSGGGSPGAEGGVPGSRIARAPAARIAALLAGQLTPSGSAARIAALVRRGGWAELFRAVEAGDVAIDWYELPPGATLARKTKARPVLVAAGRLTFSGAGAATLNVKLTRMGKWLLQRAKHIELAAKGTFTPPGMAPIVATRTFIIRR